MKQLLIVRHGQSQANADKIVCGQADSPLTPLGLDQAREAGIALRQDAIGLIVSSPLSRARQTAEIIADQIGYSPKRIEYFPELTERNLGEAQGTSYANEPCSPGETAEIDKVPGVESVQHLYDRVAKIYKQLLDRPEQTILIVCHNGVGRIFRLLANDQPAEKYYQAVPFENATIEKLPL